MWSIQCTIKRFIPERDAKEPEEIAESVLVSFFNNIHLRYKVFTSYNSDFFPVKSLLFIFFANIWIFFMLFFHYAIFSLSC